jgi:trk system potassium uptake protein TrkH
MRWFYDSGLDSDFSQTVETTFNVTSILTGTGYATQDYQNYGTVAIVIFFVMMTMGACAGSTSCGIKLFRFQVLYSIFIVQIKKLLHPHGVFLPHYSGKPISENVQTSVTSFFFIFAATFALVAIGLAATGVDFVTALSGSASAISNVGPGLGDVIGPTGNYGSLTDAAKWILCFGMLLGRLEIFTVLVLLAPSFWKR